MRRRLSLKSLLIAVAVAFGAAAAGPASAEDSRFFPTPNLFGIPVDHCESFARNCGRGGANAFCRNAGFDRAANWRTQQVPRTIIAQSNRECTSGNCTALRELTCENVAAALPPAPPPFHGGNIRRFDFPKVRGAALDHCAEFGRNCGRGGAELFCRAEGFARAQSWDTFQANRTYVAGSNRFCNGGFCTGFSQVTCEAGVTATPRPIDPVPDPGRTYRFPKVSGLAIDHCAQFGRDCGRGGADQLCRSQGFERASDWETFQAGQTFVIGSNRRCTSGNCTGFSRVTCVNTAAAPKPFIPQPVRPLPGPEQTFQYPKYQGYAVDHCERFGRNCGRGGANLFCESAGFERAERWTTYDTAQTYVIGSNRVCANSNCTGLAEVTCSGTTVTYPAPRPVDPFQPTRPATQRFDLPTERGLIVDHCARDGKRCGRGGARRFCKSKGFEKAESWDTFRPGATWILGSERRCEGSQCTGFSQVTCTN